MASLKNLRLPSIDESQNDNVGGWDETFAEDDRIPSSVAVAAGKKLASISTNAIAHGFSVFGWEKDEKERDNWIAWNQDFAPHRVLRVSSNIDGSVVVASTDGGTVSLMRGKDGKILATRKVGKTQGLQSPAEITFVGGADRYGAKDVLAILVPPGSSDSEDQEQSSPSQVILVSSIDGKKLNGTNPATIAEAARSMSIQGLNLQLSSGTSTEQQLVSLRGCFVNSNTIRFLAVESTGFLSVHDYNVDSRVATIVKQNLNIPDTWTFDPNLGIELQFCGRDDGGVYFLMAFLVDSKVKICWMELRHLHISCEYTMISSPDQKRDSRPKLYCLKPLYSCSEESSLAIAVAWKPHAPSDTVIHVVQAVVDDTDGLTQPHLIYKIPIVASGKSPSTSAQSIDIVKVKRHDTGPYAFRYKACFGDGVEECKEFRSKSGSNGDDGMGIGRFRLLIAQDKCDDADELLANLNAVSELSDNPYAKLHASEVALKRLQGILKSGNASSADNLLNAKHCLRRLAAGVVSGDEAGIQCLLDAADSVSEWPAMDTSEVPPFLDELLQALSAMTATIANAIPAAPHSLVPLLQKKKKEIEDQLVAMQCMDSVLELKNKKIPLEAPFSAVKSLGDFFNVLVSEGLFFVAEKMTRTQWGRDIPGEILASSILSISPQSDPRSYGSLLEDTLLPGLSVNHEMMPLIRTWACRTADTFDEDPSQELGLDSSILLLQTVLRAIKKLNIKVHESFAYHSPFVEREEKRRTSRLSPRNSSLDDSADLNFSNFSFHATPEEPARKNGDNSEGGERPIPTILELGKMKTGAMKSRLKAISSKSSSTSSFDDEGEDNDDSIEIKLRYAMELKAARRYGLKHSELTLSGYALNGGACYVAKRLVSIFSRSAVDDKERYTTLTKRVQPFCNKAGVSYDDAILSYTKELCDSKRTSEKAILETASLSRCCSKSLIKCQVALISFRAAHLCGKAPAYLSSLSKNALVWAAGDSSTRSELEEAIRLLVVSDIVLRYCGSGARELFQVDNLRHSIKLLDFVCRHIIHTSVLSDALDLCDAFTHLSRVDACSLILERAVKANKADRCVQLLSQIYNDNDALAIEVCARVISFCLETISDCSVAIASGRRTHIAEKFKQQAIAASSSACSMIAVIESLAGHMNCEQHLEQLGSKSWKSLRCEIERISELQTHHSVFLSLSDLRSKSKPFKTAKLLLKPVIEAYQEDDDQIKRSSFALARRGCSLLFGNDQAGLSQFWFGAIGDAARQLTKPSDGRLCVELLGAAGLLDELEREEAVHVVLSVALALCIQAFKATASSTDRRDIIISGMKYVVRASSLMHDYALVGCSRKTLPAVVSLGSLTDIVTQVLTRADEGIGEILDKFRVALNWEANKKREPLGSVSEVGCNHIDNHSERQFPKKIGLHPTWYVGDGLLLPPSEALSCSLAYCRELLGGSPSVSGTQVLHNFLGVKGAHSVALRLLCNSNSIRLSRFPSSNLSENDSVANQDTVRNLAERSLGGSGNGITAAVIDSQMAVSFLLALPIKLAFKLYKSSLPTAMSRRDFARVVVLANIGAKSGATENMGWTRQTTFVSQCRHLAKKARWWKLLQVHQVDFDPRAFDDHSSSDTSDNGKAGDIAYIASLLPALIEKSSTCLHSPEAVRNLASKFVASFGLNTYLAPQKHVEYLLSCPPIDRPGDNIDIVLLGDNRESHHADIRHNVVLCERTAKESLKLLPSAMARSAVLRRCVVELEKNSSHYTNYERHASLLSIYHTELSVVVEQSRKQQTSNLAAFKEELELIDRRRDALAILSSFFQGGKKLERPDFPKFFLPLPVPFNPEEKMSGSTVANRLSVLGLRDENDDHTFDPLDALRVFLLSNLDNATATALAPLCLSIGVPRGFIHARSLVYRFKIASSQKGAVPSVESDVLPVVNRLHSARDKTDLAEWCANQYRDNSKEKLTCLEHSLAFALQASSEAEQRRARGVRNDKKLAEEEHEALDTVKRISENKSVLHDKLVIDRQLCVQDLGSPGQVSVVYQVMHDLKNRMQSKCNEERSPENLVQFLLSEASLLVAEASLNEKLACSVSHFRHLASAVHEGCKVLADQHSHVHAGHIARNLARRWLVHGDEKMSAAKSDKASSINEDIKRNKGDVSLSIVEDDTMEFVMDLNSLGEVLQDDVGSSSHFKAVDQITTSEESSSLKVNGSSREASEYACRRVALRIAFAMSFAEEFHSLEQGDVDKENANSSLNTRAVPKSSKTSKSSLLSQIATSKQTGQNKNVLEHTKELLRVVFAQSGGSSWVSSTKSLLGSSGEPSLSQEEETRNTITFAMRYRALRTVSILCPQEALDRVIREEGYLSNTSGRTGCTLKKCAFGSFVAKEIEEMGLPLPHSDLSQLSTMHFPSYARALWRHHISGDTPKGRLLLLLLEMTLKEDTVSDKALVVSTMDTMSNLDLPRSLIIGCEQIDAFRRRSVPTEFEALFHEINEVFSKAITNAARSVFGEIHEKCSSADPCVDVVPTLLAVQRVGTVVEHFVDVKGGEERLRQFIQVLMKILPNAKNEELCDGLAVIALSAISRLQDRKQLFLQLSRFQCGQKALQVRFPRLESVQEDDKEESKSLLFLAKRLDFSFMYRS